MRLAFDFCCLRHLRLSSQLLLVCVLWCLWFVDSMLLVLVVGLIFWEVLVLWVCELSVWVLVFLLNRLFLWCFLLSGAFCFRELQFDCSFAATHFHVHFRPLGASTALSWHPPPVSLFPAYRLYPPQRFLFAFMTSVRANHAGGAIVGKCNTSVKESQLIMRCIQNQYINWDKNETVCRASISGELFVRRSYRSTA